MVDTNKIRTCSYLLPDPGGEVVRGLLDEIERLRAEGVQAMKVYRVVMPYFDGDHDHGSYESPLFSTRELAEQFLAALKAEPDGSDKRWWSDAGMRDLGPDDAAIAEVEVQESVGVLRSSRDYRSISYT